MIKLYKNIVHVLSGKERKKFYQHLVINTVVNIADIISLALLLMVVNFYIHSSKNLFAFLPSWLTDHTSPMLIVLFLLLFIIKNIAAYLAMRSQYRFAYNVAGRISREQLSRQLRSDYMNYINIDSSVSMRRISQQPTEYCQYVLMGVFQIISQFILTILTVAAIIIFDARLFFLQLIILLPAVLIAVLLMKRKLKIIRTQTRLNSEKASQHLKEAMDGYIESSIYNAADFFTKRYGEYQGNLNNRLADLQIIQNLPNRLIEIFGVLGLFILILMRKSSETSPENVILIGAFLAAMYKIIPGVVKMVTLSGQVSAYKFAIDGLAPIAQVQQDAGAQIASIDSIQLRNIWFSYKRRTILKEFSLSLKKGDFLIITGDSGIGKTTILKLLLGYLSPERGEIVFNEKSIDKKGIENYRSHIAYIKQQSFLIHDTLLRNITLQENSYDVKRLQNALEISGLNSIIETWPERLNKIITENGKNISGGQRQRIALARAIYKKAGLIILDEPFNELDEGSEKELLDRLKDFSQTDGMVILITHNKQAISYCTELISLDENYKNISYSEPGVS
ncbi:MAG: ABC transporter ATP-binding protein [Chitinophagaceae bacterium]